MHCDRPQAKENGVAGPLRARSPAVAAKEVPAPKPSIRMAGV